MPMKIKVDGPAIRKARNQKNISRQELCNLAKDMGLNIGRASIERMEGAASTDLFIQDKVKIVAEALGINLIDIIVVNHDSVERIETKLVTSGRELREILDRTEKLVLDVRIEPNDKDLQELIIKTVTAWDNEAKRFDEPKSQIDQIKNDFENKNLIEHFASSDIHIYHASSHQIAYFDIDCNWEEDDDGNIIGDYGSGRAEFASCSYDSVENAQNGFPGFDGVGAQIVDYLIMCPTQEAPIIFHETNPFGFREGTLRHYQDEFKNSNQS
jgi:hypothetical protein